MHVGVLHEGLDLGSDRVLHEGSDLGSDNANVALGHSVLMVRANAREGNGLIHLGGLRHEFFVFEMSIVAMIGLDVDTKIFGNAFKAAFGEDSVDATKRDLMKALDKIAGVVGKHCATTKLGAGAFLATGMGETAFDGR